MCLFFIHIYKTEKNQIGFLKGIQNWQKALYTFPLLLGLLPYFPFSLELMNHINSPNVIQNVRVFLIKRRIAFE